MEAILRQENKFIDINSQITCSAVQAATNLCNEAKITRSNKTPISLLQEVSTKCSCQPIYENISKEGCSQSEFEYKVTVGDMSAIARGTSKKAAKHAAALQIFSDLRSKSIGQNDVLAEKIEYLLESIKNQASLDEPNIQEQADKADAVVSNDSVAEQTNPVGTLLELTQKFSLRPPIFDFMEEEGESHNKNYICNANFGDFKEVGCGRSKKIAKRNAALLLLNTLKLNDSFKNLKIEKTTNELTGITSKEKHKKSSVNFFTLLKSSTNPVIMGLLKNTSESLNEDSLTKELLDRLAQEENFQYKIFNLGKNKTGLHQILLQIKVNPILVMNGRGITIEDAIKDAAYNTLTLLKLLCNR